MNRDLVTWLNAIAATAKSTARKVETGKDWPGDVEAALALLQDWLKEASRERLR